MILNICHWFITSLDFNVQNQDFRVLYIYLWLGVLTFPLSETQII